MIATIRIIIQNHVELIKLADSTVATAAEALADGDAPEALAVGVGLAFLTAEEVEADGVAVAATALLMTTETVPEE